MYVNTTSAAINIGSFDYSCNNEVKKISRKLLKYLELVFTRNYV